MTLLLLVGVAAMMIISKKVGGGSAKYFIKQQQSIGKAEGFIQEMMNGQKVIKVFNHEEECISDLKKSIRRFATIAAKQTPMPIF